MIIQVEPHRGCQQQKEWAREITRDPVTTSDPDKTETNQERNKTMKPDKAWVAVLKTSILIAIIARRRITEGVGR
jgi:hypothetical protein